MVRCPLTMFYALVIVIVVAVAITATSCKGQERATTSAPRRSTAPTTANAAPAVPRRPLISDCAKSKVPWSQRGSYAAFFGGGRYALWVPAVSSRCLYVVRGRIARPIWEAKERETIRGVMWAPTGTELVVVTSGRDGRRIERLSAAGRRIAVLDGKSASWTRSGQLVIQRRDGLLRAGTRGVRRIVSTARLAKVAGFQGHLSTIGEDTLGYQRGAGTSGVALVWASWPTSHAVVLIVHLNGTVTRASPIFAPGRYPGGVGGLSWSSDGKRLFLLLKAPTPPGFTYGHDHCVMRWTRQSGYRMTFCMTDLPPPSRHHFDKLVWSSDGSRGLLNNGTVIDRAGRPIGDLAAKPTWGAFSAHWK